MRPLISGVLAPIHLRISSTVCRRGVKLWVPLAWPNARADKGCSWSLQAHLPRRTTVLLYPACKPPAPHLSHMGCWELRTYPLRIGDGHQVEEVDDAPLGLNRDAGCRLVMLRLGLRCLLGQQPILLLLPSLLRLLWCGLLQLYDLGHAEGITGVWGPGGQTAQLALPVLD